MALLNNAQKRVLAELTEAKELYDQQEVALQARVAEQRNINKDRLRRLVAACRDSNIPTRQIHLVGMGMGQAQQMTGFFANGSGKGWQDLLDTSEAGNLVVKLAPTETVEAAPGKRAKKTPEEIEALRAKLISNPPPRFPTNDTE